MHYMRLFICVALLLTVGRAATAAMLIENPGFETGDIEPWEHYQFVDPAHSVPPPPEETWYATEDNPHSGNYCAAGIGSNYIFQQRFFYPDLELADIVEFSFWVRQEYVPNQLFPLVNLVFDDDPYDWRPGIGHLRGLDLNGTEWTHYDGMAMLQDEWEFAERILGPETTLVSVGIMGFFPGMSGEPPNHVYVDDWVLRTPEPTSLMLLGAGGCALFRRRRA